MRNIKKLQNLLLVLNIAIIIITGLIATYTMHFTKSEALMNEFFDTFQNSKGIAGIFNTTPIIEIASEYTVPFFTWLMYITCSVSAIILILKVLMKHMPILYFITTIITSLSFIWTLYKIWYLWPISLIEVVVSITGIYISVKEGKNTQ